MFITRFEQLNINTKRKKNNNLKNIRNLVKKQMSYCECFEKIHRSCRVNNDILINSKKFNVIFHNDNNIKNKISKRNDIKF